MLCVLKIVDGGIVDADKVVALSLGYQLLLALRQEAAEVVCKLLSCARFGHFASSFGLQCNAGSSSATGNRRAVLVDFLKQAVTARRELNPKLFEEGAYIFMLTAEGKKRYLSNSMEGEGFAVECRCGKYHVRFCTLHSINASYDLFCQWCECESDSWTGSGKDPVSAAEKDAMQALQRAKLDQSTACQVVLPFWHGRLDFYHIPSKTAMQADGSSHFVSMHDRAPHIQLMNDIECCSKAWKQGVRLLRVHHKYGRAEEAMIVATQLPYDSFVMLTGGYDRVVVWCDGEHINYIDLLTSRLGGARYQQLGVPGCVVFY